MQGQANVFNLYAAEKYPYAIKRYLDETNRLYSILEKRLGESAWLAGDSYGIADIKAFGWVHRGKRTGIEMELYPNIGVRVFLFFLLGDILGEEADVVVSAGLVGEDPRPSWGAARAERPAPRAGRGSRFGALGGRGEVMVKSPFM